jgi:hypothetical protein
MLQSCSLQFLSTSMISHWAATYYSIQLTECWWDLCLLANQTLGILNRKSNQFKHKILICVQKKNKEKTKQTQNTCYDQWIMEPIPGKDTNLCNVSRLTSMQQNTVHMEIRKLQSGRVHQWRVHGEQSTQWRGMPMPIGPLFSWHFWMHSYGVGNTLFPLLLNLSMFFPWLIAWMVGLISEDPAPPTVGWMRNDIGPRYHQRGYQRGFWCCSNGGS